MSSTYYQILKFINSRNTVGSEHIVTAKSTTVQIVGFKFVSFSLSIYMLCAKHGFAQSIDCAALSMDPRFVWAIHGLHYVCAIPGLRKLHVQSFYATWHVPINDER